MNVVTVVDGSLYPLPADHYSRQSGDREVHFSYMVLGRVGTGDGDRAIVIEGSGSDATMAIQEVVQKAKLLRDWMDVACHGSFWRVLQSAEDERLDKLRAELGLPNPKAKLTEKKKDEGLS